MESVEDLHAILESPRRVYNAMPYFDEADRELLRERFDRVINGMLTKGPFVEEFEAAFADRCGTQHAVAVHSGASALEATLSYLLRDRPGAEVIVPALTFVASANSVVLAGGTPVIADIAPDGLCLSLDTIEACVSERTAGVMLVPMLGFLPGDLDRIQSFCSERGLFLIEDAAHSHGSTYDGVASGALADAGCFSFYSTKVLTSAEGGMVTTDDDALASFVRSYRHHGLDMDGTKVDCIRPGTNVRMDELRAAVGLTQTVKLDAHLSQRREIAAFYYGQLEGIDGIDAIPHAERVVPSFWKFPVRAQPGLDVRQIEAHLSSEFGVFASAPYRPLCHQHSYYRERYDYADGDFPNAERLVESYTTLPVHAGMTLDDALYVVEALRTVVARLLT